MIISLLHLDHATHKIKHESHNLSDFFFVIKKSVREMIQLTATQISKNIENSDFQEFKHQFDKGKTYTFFVKVIRDDVYFVVVSDDYPRHIAYMLIKEMCVSVNRTRECIESGEDVSSTTLKKIGGMFKGKENDVNKDFEMLQAEFQNYEEKDLLMSVNKELEETKEILSRTLEDVVGRGEKIDGLIDSAESLSSQTKALFKMSKKQNRCC